LRNSALVLLQDTVNYLLAKYWLQSLIFKITVLPAFAKLAVKYWPGRWDTGHLATLRPCDAVVGIGEKWRKLILQKGTYNKIRANIVFWHHRKKLL